MSTRYELPKNEPSFARNLFVWGLPLMGWIVLILGWIFFFDGDKTEEEKVVEKTEQVAEQPAVPGETAPAEAAAGKTAAAEADKIVSVPEKKVAADAPYDFTSAVSKIGLINESCCGTGILVDPATRKVLWAKSADKAVPIASMTKMMTMLLTEEAILAGRITRETVIPVTVAAYKIGGSQVWLDPKESFPLNELMKAIAIKSANDAAYLVGEYLGNGDVGAFVKDMNRRAKELGMTKTVFYETHGLGDAQKRNNLASAHDMVILGEHLLNYPETMRLAATRMDTFRNGKTELKNHNNLVFNRVPGVTGLKTGYTSASGFCVTITCDRGGRKLLACVTGFKSAKDRDAFCKALLDWGYTK